MNWARSDSYSPIKKLFELNKRLDYFDPYICKSHKVVQLSYEVWAITAQKTEKGLLESVLNLQAVWLCLKLSKTDFSYKWTVELLTLREVSLSKARVVFSLFDISGVQLYK